MKKTLLDFLKKAGRRIKCQQLIHTILSGLMMSLGICLTILILSLIITVPYALEKCIGIIGLGTVFSIIYGVIKAPNNQEIARLVDQTGLEERVSTALMLIEDETAVSKLQREDTLSHIKGYNLKTHFPISVPIKAVVYNILLMMLCIVVAMIPSKAKEHEKSLRAFDKEKKEVLKEIEEAKELIKQEETLSKIEKEELMQLLEKTVEELPKTANIEEIEKAMERLDKKMEKLSEKLDTKEAKDAVDAINKNLTEEFEKKEIERAEADLDSISEVLDKNELTKKLAEMLQDENIAEEQLEQELEELEQQLQELSEAEKAALANSLNQAAAGLNNQQLASQLTNASNTISQGNLNAKDLQSALKNLKKTARKLSTSNRQGNKQGQNGAGQGNEQGQNGAGQGNGQGQNGAGRGNNGQGQNGVGQGNGSGWNTGSKVGKQEESDGSTKKPIEGEVPGYETNLSGEVDETSDMNRSEIEYGINIAGEKVDYHSVIGDYTDEALEDIENTSVPENMKDTVRDYFEAINK